MMQLHKQLSQVRGSLCSQKSKVQLFFFDLTLHQYELMVKLIVQSQRVMLIFIWQTLKIRVIKAPVQTVCFESNVIRHFQQLKTKFTPIFVRSNIPPHVPLNSALNFLVIARLRKNSFHEESNSLLLKNGPLIELELWFIFLVPLMVLKFEQKIINLTISTIITQLSIMVREKFL